MRITRIMEWQEGKAMDHSSAKAEETIRQAGWYYVYKKGITSTSSIPQSLGKSPSPPIEKT